MQVSFETLMIKNLLFFSTKSKKGIVLELSFLLQPPTYKVR